MNKPRDDLMVFVIDWRPEAEGGGAGWREEACSEEGADVGWCHAAGTAGRET